MKVSDKSANIPNFKCSSCVSRLYQDGVHFGQSHEEMFTVDYLAIFSLPELFIQRYRNSLVNIGQQRFATFEV